MENLRDSFSTGIGSGCFTSNTSLFQKRNSSELVRRQLYKTKMCAFYNVGKCTRGTLCAFAHSVQELRPLPDLRFTRLCELTKRGDICRDVNCTFAHSLNDLRTTEIPPSPLSELSISRPIDNTTLIRKLNTTGESKYKFRSTDLIKDSFINKCDTEDIFVSSTDTTPHNLSLHLKTQERESICSWKKSDLSTCQTIKNIRNGIFSYLNNSDISQLDNTWIYNEDFSSKFSPEFSDISSEASCRFIHQVDFQDPPNYFSSKCQLSKGIQKWDLINCEDKISTLQYDILNIIGNDNNSSQYSKDISSIEKGTLHIIN